MSDKIELANDEVKNTVLAVFEGEDGSEEEVTGADFAELLDAITGQEAPDRQTIDKLKALLKSILKYYEGKPEVLENPTSKSILNSIAIIYDFILWREGTLTEKPQNTPGEFEKFLQGKQEFMIIPRPAGIEELLNICKLGSAKVTKDTKKVKVSIVGRLSIDEQKINDLIRLSFSSANPHQARRNFNTLTEFSFTQTMKILKRAQTEDNKKKFSEQLRTEILPNIAHTHIEYTVGNNKKWFRVDIGGGFYAVDIKKDKIYFRISEEYAFYLNSKTFSQYNSKVLYLGSRMNPLPHYIAIKLQIQYFNDGNRKKGTHNILSIKTILAFCANEYNYSLPSFEYVQKTDPGHWARRIKKPFEKAMNDIEKIGLFKWEYCGPRLQEVTKEQTETRDYYEWIKLYITFQLIPEEPDQTERLENKQKRIEAAKEAKDVKDAQTIIEADKIKKRKSKKKTEKKTAPATT